MLLQHESSIRRTWPGRALPRGFTLIELLIVMSIIAILIAITIPAVMKARETSNRSTCSNNLRQMGVAFINHATQYGYFPTAGLQDYYGPTYDTKGSPNVGRNQAAGWPFQILPFMDSEPLWLGGVNFASSGGSNTVSQVTATCSTPLKAFFCPSRRQPTTITASSGNSSFPANATVYTHPSGSGSAITAGSLVVSPIDYAACGGQIGTSTPSAITLVGPVQTQQNGRATVATSDITDGVSYTMLLGEKAANPFLNPPTITNEDDTSAFSGYGLPSGTTGAVTGQIGVNLNNIRFTGTGQPPLRDIEVKAATGGSFGSAHFGTVQICMCDGSVMPISYQIDTTTYAALGSIKGNEIISDDKLQD